MSIFHPLRGYFIGEKRMKKCNKCGETKELTEFHKDKSKKHGRDSKCKVCTKQYYQAKREHILERHRQHYRENREAYNARKQKRLALKRDAAGNATAADIQARFDYHGNRCYYCGCDGKMQIEHRIPLSRGGTHYPANIVPACEHCNKSKGAKTEKEFLNRCPTTA